MTKRLLDKELSTNTGLLDLFVAEEVFQLILHFIKDVKSWGCLLLSTNTLYSDEPRRKTVLARILSRKYRIYQSRFDRIDQLHASGFTLPHVYIVNIIMDAFDEDNNEDRRKELDLDNSYDEDCGRDGDEVITLTHCETKQIPMGEKILCVLEEIQIGKKLSDLKKERRSFITNQIKEFEQYLELDKLHEILNTLASFDRITKDRDGYYKIEHAYHQQYKLINLLIKKQQI